MFAPCAFAQGDLTVDGMVRQLQPAPMTRGLGRNLVVTPAKPEEGPGTGALPASPAQEHTERPSLSLLINFDLNSDRVKPESLATVETLAGALRSPALASTRFTIEGHTDALGKPAYNLKLSERRAASVRRMLVDRGVMPQRLVAVGKGSTELANPADPRSAENRRVRIVNME